MTHKSTRHTSSGRKCEYCRRMEANAKRASYQTLPSSAGTTNPYVAEITTGDMGKFSAKTDLEDSIFYRKYFDDPTTINDGNVTDSYLMEVQGATIHPPPSISNSYKTDNSKRIGEILASELESSVADFSKLNQRENKRKSHLQQKEKNQQNIAQDLVKMAVVEPNHESNDHKIYSTTVTFICNADCKRNMMNRIIKANFRKEEDVLIADPHIRSEKCKELRVVSPRKMRDALHTKKNEGEQIRCNLKYTGILKPNDAPKVVNRTKDAKNKCEQYDERENHHNDLLRRYREFADRCRNIQLRRRFWQTQNEEIRNELEQMYANKAKTTTNEKPEVNIGAPPRATKDRNSFSECNFNASTSTRFGKGRIKRLTQMWERITKEEL
ncbi:hypothetical protein ACOME3_004366 [Neoechinorhynchus agilis]